MEDDAAFCCAAAVVGAVVEDRCEGMMAACLRFRPRATLYFVVLQRASQRECTELRTHPAADQRTLTQALMHSFAAGGNTHVAGFVWSFITHLKQRTKSGRVRQCFDNQEPLTKTALRQPQTLKQREGEGEGEGRARAYTHIYTHTHTHTHTHTLIHTYAAFSSARSQQYAAAAAATSATPETARASVSSIAMSATAAATTATTAVEREGSPCTHTSRPAKPATSGRVVLCVCVSMNRLAVALSACLSLHQAVQAVCVPSASVTLVAVTSRERLTGLRIDALLNFCH